MGLEVVAEGIQPTADSFCAWWSTLLTHGDTFSISALHLVMKVPYFSNSGQKNEKVTSYLHRRKSFWVPVIGNPGACVGSAERSGCDGSSGIPPSEALRLSELLDAFQSGGSCP
eukprot:SAG31_NODE_3010_length_4788_cov_4.266098_6_plen_114_part_00